MSKDVRKNEGANSNSGAYETGYCMPPKHSQFKKGNTMGKGRPKGAKNLKTIVNEALNQKVPAQIGGKTRKLSKIELTVHQVANKASQGDHKAAERALALYERYGPQEDLSGPEPDKVRKDLEALREYLAMQDAIYPPENQEDDDGQG